MPLTSKNPFSVGLVSGEQSDQSILGQKMRAYADFHLFMARRVKNHNRRRRPQG